MLNEKMRRWLGGAAVIGLTAAVAGCAHNAPQQPANAYPPPAAETTPPPAYGSTNQPAARYSVNAPELHLRSGPGVNNPVIGTLPSGTQVRATGSEQGDWWEVQTPDGTGWVGSRYLWPTRFSAD